MDFEFDTNLDGAVIKVIGVSSASNNALILDPLGIATLSSTDTRFFLSHAINVLLSESTEPIKENVCHSSPVKPLLSQGLHEV